MVRDIISAFLGRYFILGLKIRKHAQYYRRVLREKLTFGGRSRKRPESSLGTFFFSPNLQWIRGRNSQIILLKKVTISLTFFGKLCLVHLCSEKKMWHGSLFFRFQLVVCMFRSVSLCIFYVHLSSTNKMWYESCSLQ